MKTVVSIVSVFFVVYELVNAIPPTNYECGELEDGDIIIHNYTTWQMCENEQLVNKYCILSHNDTYLECVPYQSVVEKVKSYLDRPSMEPYHAELRSYFRNTELTDIDCDKVLYGPYGGYMQRFQNKQDCTAGLKKVAQSASLPLCYLLSDNAVYYFNSTGQYGCNLGKFKLMQN